MKNEHLDIVDENNQPTGKAELRSVVHAKGLWHRTVHIYFFRKNGDGIDFLVHLRSKEKDLYPNCWDARFGGHVKSGESLDEAVVNEIKEEVGIDVKTTDITFGGSVKWDGGTNREFIQFYFLEFTKSLDELSFSDGEVQEIRWMSSDEIITSMNNNPDKWSGDAESFANVLEKIY